MHRPLLPANLEGKSRLLPVRGLLTLRPACDVKPRSPMGFEDLYAVQVHCQGALGLDLPAAHSEQQYLCLPGEPLRLWPGRHFVSSPRCSREASQEVSLPRCSERELYL